ncbi:hypothetical protein PoB_000060100 [Plakobranchus ocellatus]|uniref:Uncharacterized protein n=1 Tax=Plakobranchus ocellatus TaxID=259542 RepID=A0AAV3XVM9_9GAST|nr:hypothetical protein PoB_000060100 [Plakobranchus ocellatus]
MFSISLYLQVSCFEYTSNNAVSGNENVDKLAKAALNRAVSPRKFFCWPDPKPKVGDLPALIELIAGGKPNTATEGLGRYDYRDISKTGRWRGNGLSNASEIFRDSLVELELTNVILA